jgi:LmbE family N-acetylglucosaminyl deacetylase
MIDLKMTVKGKTLKVLCLGAHSDDIEIGCGGTILKLIGDGKGVACDWVVFSAAGPRKGEADRSASAFMAGAAKRTVAVEGFRDGFFPFIGADLKDYFEGLKTRVKPDLIFTHHRADLHQDHRIISDLTWNTFRDHLILEYEVPKYDADLGSPNIYVPLDGAAVKKKIRFIMKNFASQAKNHWFTEETFRAVLRLRGVESNAPSGYAEGFHGRKLTLD